MNFASDSLSWTFAAAATLLSTAVILFGQWYFHTSYRRNFRLLVAGCWAAFLGALLASDWLVFVVFVELSTLALWRMIAFKDRQAATLYLLVQLGGAGLLLVGAAGSATVGGSLAIGPVSGTWRWFFLAGLGTKAAFPILHFWLPEAHSKAPAPASALLSGFAVKLGVYGLLRAFPEGFAPLPAIGVVMVLYGGIMALFSRDIKRLLAYSTMSHLGFMTTAAGVGAGVATALYGFVHALFKGLLFLDSGMIEKTAGTRDLESLRGSARIIPAVTALLVFGAFASSGFPPSASYTSKGAVLAALKDLPVGWSLTALKLSGAVTAAYLLRAVLPFLSHDGLISLKGTTAAKKDGSKTWAWAALGGLSLMLAALGTNQEWLPGITAPLPVAKSPYTSYLVQAAVGFVLYLFASRSSRALPRGLPDALGGPVLKIKDLVLVSSGLLSRIHGGSLNFYVMVALSFLMVLLSMLS